MDIQDKNEVNDNGYSVAALDVAMDQPLPLSLVEEFRLKNHSLRLSASQISSLSGFHPFAHLPTLLRDLVYQGGHLLLNDDVKALGLVLQTEEEILLNLAKQAGLETQLAVKSALKVKKGKTILDTTQAAASIKQNVLEAAVKSKKLKPEQLLQLKKATRSWVDTGFGTYHEDNALDLYEKKCGWEVRDRNEAILSWPFATSEVGLYNTVEPIDKAEVISLYKILDNQQKAPFFVICGSIDGIRDEMWCPPNQGVTDGLEEEWELRRVVVECKHRMRNAHSTPPLYDQIQTLVYCLMLDTTEADIIQVTRSITETSRNQQQTQTQTLDDKEIAMSEVCVSAVDSETQHDSMMVSTDPSGNKRKARKQKLRKERKVKPKSVVDIAVSRISLDDPIMQHRSNWEIMILPRLRLFVETVYSIRGDNEKRRLLLLACDIAAPGSLEAWDLLHQECPWLLNCDTAYHRELRDTIE